MKLKINQFLLALCVVVVLLAGCSKEGKKNGHLRRGEEHFKAGDYDRAELEYMNVLRLDATNYVASRNLGLMAFEQGRIGYANAFLTQAKKVNGEDPEVRVKLGMIQLAAGKSKEALDEAIVVLERQPTNMEALLLLVDSSLTTNQLAETQQRLAKLQPLIGNTAGFQLASGSILARNRDLAGAERNFRQALAIAPNSAFAHGMLGNLYAFRNDQTNAEAEFKAAAEHAPWRSPFRIRYADFKIATGGTSNGLELLGQIIKKAPDFLPASIRLAQIAYAEKRFPDCEAALKSVLVRDAGNADAMLLMVRLRMAQNQPDKAMIELERAVKIYPRLPQIHYQMAVIHLMLNDLAGAVKKLNDALAARPDYAEAILLLAEINVRRGDAVAAVGSLTKLVQNQPDLAQAQLLLATAHRAAGQLEAALRIYENLSRNYPTNPEPVFLTGLVQTQQGKTNEARTSYEKALSFSPSSLAAVEQLVNLDLRERKFTTAIQRVQQQVDRNPSNAAPYLLLAQVHLAETNLSSAESTLVNALRVAPDSRPVNAMLARVYVMSNKQQEALQKLNQLVARNTNDVASWLQIADLQSAATNYAAARQAYEKILAINPKEIVALNNLAWLCTEHLGDLKLATELASKAHELLPDDASTSDTLGWVLYRNGDYPRALGLIQQSAKKLSENPEIMFHLGMAHYMMGEEAAARVALQNAVQLGREGSWRTEAAQRLQVLEIDPATADAAKLAALALQLPGDTILLTRQGNVAEREGAWEKAAAFYESALKINPKLVPAMVKLAQLNATQLKNHTRAFELARRARDLEPEDPKIAHTLGRLAYLSAETPADFQWAHGLLQQSARSLPDDPDVLSDYALAAYAIGQVTNAMVAMQKVLDSKPPSHLADQASLFLEMNSLVIKPSDIGGSAARIQTVLKQNPDYVPAMMAVALLKEASGDFAGARDVYQNVLRRWPVYSPANRALALLYFGSLREMQKAYDFAVVAREAFPRDPQVARVLGLLSFQRGEFSRAVQLLNECAMTYPKDADILYSLGFSQLRVKQATEGKVSLRKALELSPNSPSAQEARKLVSESK